MLISCLGNGRYKRFDGDAFLTYWLQDTVAVQRCHFHQSGALPEVSKEQRHERVNQIAHARNSVQWWLEPGRLFLH